MSGELHLDVLGVAALAQDLRMHGSSVAEHAAAADHALVAVTASATSPLLVEALHAFASRFRSRGEPVGTRVDQLGAVATAAATALTSTDAALAAAVPTTGR